MKKNNRFLMFCAMVVALCLTSFFSLNATPKWKLVKFLSSGNGVYDYSINTIECIDSSYCLALGVSDWDPKLYLSTDKGKNWELIVDGNASYNTQSECICMAYPHKDHIFLGYANATIHHSLDRGKTWDTNKVVIADTLIDHNFLRIDNLAMSDTLNGVAIAEVKQIGIGKKGGTFLLVTNDAWKTIKIIEKYDIPGGSKSNLFPYPINKDTMMLFYYADGNTCVLTSYDGAKSWGSADTIKGINTDVSYDAMPLRQSPDGSYWLAGSRRNNVGHQSIDIIYKLDKFGGTWTKVYEKELYPVFGLQGIAFGDALNGVAVGAFGKVLRTNDGGNTWKKDTLIDEKNRIADTPVMNVTYCGSTPIISDMHGSIWILEDIASGSKEEIISNLQIIYPNPTCDYLNIKDIENISEEVEIYNLTGEVLLRCAPTPNIDIRVLPAGVYYAKINNQLNKFIKK